MNVTVEPVPSGPDKLSNEWLTAALRRSGAIGESAVSTHSWKSVERPGAAGIVVRITLDYEGPSEAAAPQTIIAKFASQYAPLRSLLNSHGLYRTEVEFYRHFGADAGIPVPRCYFADLDPSSGYFVLLLEDMRDCRVGDPLRGQAHPASTFRPPASRSSWLSSSAIFSRILRSSRALENSMARRTAFCTACALERPWPMKQPPFKPSSGAAPYSV